MAVWAWEGKCCLAVKVVTSSIREASEAPASPHSLKTVAAILRNITLVIRTSGLVQHWPQQNLVVYYKTLPGLARHSCRTRGSRIVWPKQIKWSQTSPARNKSVHPLVVKAWRDLDSFLPLSPSLILSRAVCAGHGFWCYIDTCVHTSGPVFFFFCLSFHFL